jgi:SAM-dependent methyltransferase
VLVIREDLARRYLSGSGIEIGALAFPLRVPPSARVTHVDYLPTAELARVHADSGINVAAIPEVQVVDDASTLSKFSDASLDFVIANHVLEHIEDPITCLSAFLRVLRAGGILFLLLPDARRTFDAPRPRTSVAHVLRDHDAGPAVSRHEHYEEWARFNDALPEAEVPARVAHFAATDARHHFHVWELDGFLELLRTLALPCELQHAQLHGHEFAVILRKL